MENFTFYIPNEKNTKTINEMMDFYHVEQTNKAMQFQINFNDSKFQLQTSFDGTENLHLDINSFVILYNSFDDGVFPFGNIFITGNYSVKDQSNDNQKKNSINSNQKDKNIMKVHKEPDKELYKIKVNKFL